MKQAKQRVVAIDYFRGLCLLIVLFSHSYYFSRPYSYLSGHNKLWVSAAEIFFLLSGITFSIVRGQMVQTNFRLVLKKSLRRAGIIYFLNILLVTYSIGVGFFLTAKGLNFYGTEGLPTQSGLHLLINILTFRSPAGWADFLMYFCVFLALAPFMNLCMRSRLWPLIILASFILYLSHNKLTPYAGFAVWQLYFILGIAIGNFRGAISNSISKLSAKSEQFIYRLTLSVAFFMLCISVLTAYPKLYYYLDLLVNSGWLPSKIRGAYYHLLSHQTTLDHWFNYSRTGVLRPIVALVVISAAYLIYQRHEGFILKWTGKVMIRVGKDSLWVYVAQAIIIPLIAAIPIAFGGLLIDTLFTSLFLCLMWVVTSRRNIVKSISLYVSELKTSYYRGKYNYIQRYEI